MATAIEGHEMAQRGRAGPALATAAIGSFVAGTIGILLLTFLAAAGRRPGRPAAAGRLLRADRAGVRGGDRAGRPLADPRDAVAVHRPVHRAGRDRPVSGQSRLTFGVDQLNSGVDVVLVAVGLFAVGEALYVASRLRHAPEDEIARGVGRQDAVAARTRGARGGRGCAAPRSGSRSARCRPAARRSRRSCPTRSSAGSRAGTRRRSSARARSRASPGPRRPTTPPSPACWCRC